eukprot:15323110-Ditylum_brightwellii.AAC.1
MYPLPIIQDVIQRRSDYNYFTKLDLSMFFYNLKLDEESQELCTIVTPFGKFQYCRMAMGLKISPNEVQAIIEEVLMGLDVEIYIDDIGIFSANYDEHLELVRKVLKRLQDNNLKVNLLKCKWAIQETDLLGSWLIPTGICPWKKKAEAVLEM